jgi:hypothetical protein
MTGDEILRFFRVLRGFGFAASSKRFWNIMIRYIYPPLGLDVNTKGASPLSYTSHCRVITPFASTLPYPTVGC